MIEVLKPGLQTTVQDLGRQGQLALALPPSGAMDQFAHRLANALVGNDADAATLEMAFMGPTLRAHVDTTVAVTGADVELFLDDVPQDTWTAIPVRRGQEIRLGLARRGVRAYVAVRGGLEVPVVMGSRSTFLPTAIGGLEGRALRAGDSIPVGAADAGVVEGTLPDALRPAASSEQDVRIVIGLAAHRFTPESLDIFTRGSYTVTVESNRTGYRFAGDPLDFVPREVPFGAGDNPSNVVSFGYPLGSIQVPNGQEPICLLRDGVTGGGFATLGTVVTADLDLLAQARSPDAVRFVPVDVATALEIRRERAARVARAIDAIN